MSSNLESEDLENVQLVRMEDVQPSREWSSEEVVIKDEGVVEEDMYLVKEEELETCIVDDLEYDNECVVDGNDEDPNIGSMVSVHSEELSGDNSTSELIVPEIIAPKKFVEDTSLIIRKTTGPASWPTLEILPGGVINHLEKHEDDPHIDLAKKSGEMVYACAKCPEQFRYLCGLVQHVRWHTLQQKKEKELSDIYPMRNFQSNRTRGAARGPKKNYVYLRTEAASSPLVIKTYKKLVKIKPKKSKS